MKTKVIEIRDEATCIACIAMQMESTASGPLQYWLRRYGYPADGSSIMLMMLSNGRATNDPYEWPELGLGRRTMGNAHNWIIDHWDEIADGDVVDVRVILGETQESAVSERLHGSWL